MAHRLTFSPTIPLVAGCGFVGIILLTMLRMAAGPPEVRSSDAGPPVVAAAKVAPAPADCPKIKVFFSPRGGCEEAIVREIDNAKTTIRVQAFSFTSPAIERALAAAQTRGVDVRVALDDSNANPKTSQADELAAAGVPVLLDGRHAISHSKVISIDSHIVITGSYNFTVAARDSNLKNLLIIDDRATAGRYLENWDQHREHCTPLGGP